MRILDWDLGRGFGGMGGIWIVILGDFLGFLRFFLSERGFGTGIWGDGGGDISFVGGWGLVSGQARGLAVASCWGDEWVAGPAVFGLCVRQVGTVPRPSGLEQIMVRSDQSKFAFFGTCSYDPVQRVST